MGVCVRQGAGNQNGCGLSSEASGRDITLLCMARSRRGKGRKGKKHPRVAEGLRLSIPLCSLTVFNSYILMPRRPLCHSTSAPSRSHLGAAKWISSRRGCRLPRCGAAAPARLPRSRAAARRASAPPLAAGRRAASPGTAWRAPGGCAL